MGDVTPSQAGNPIGSELVILILGLLTLTEGLSMGTEYCHRCSLTVTGYLISMSVMRIIMSYNGCLVITRVMVVTDIWIL